MEILGKGKKTRSDEFLMKRVLLSPLLLALGLSTHAEIDPKMGLSIKFQSLIE